MKPMVSLKLLLTTLILTSIIAGCTNSPTQPNYDLDFYTLTHSAVFTQRELVNSLLESSNNSPTSPPPSLLNSYCDLVDRGIIFVSTENIPLQCSNRTINHQSRSCAVEFHECVRVCSLRTDNCRSCIERQNKCLQPDTLSGHSLDE